MSEFKVGDRVRIKLDAEADGAPKPGEVGTITSVGSDGAWFGPEFQRGAFYFFGEMEHEYLHSRAYLAGPMRGISEFNFPAFLDAEKALSKAGIEVFNPATHDINNGFDYKGLTGNEDLSSLGFDLRKALGADVDFIARESIGVIVLPGWENSSGARAEVALANALKLPVVELDEALEWGSKWEQAPQVGDGHAEFEWRTGSSHHHRVDPDPATTRLNLAPGIEIRSVSSTGGEKGTKAERYDLLPVEALASVARHYGVGAAKYADHNWRRGYEWSKSYSALQRHATAFWSGEDIDAETGSPHMAAVAFHALTLLTFMEEQSSFDDRYKKESTAA